MALNFDFSPIPEDAIIEKAELSIFFLAYALEYEKPILCSLFTCAKQWKEDEVTWNHATASELWEQTDPEIGVPGGGDITRPYLDAVLMDPMETWIHFDVTQTVIKVLAEPQTPFYGFVMKEEISDTASLKNSEGASYYASEHTVIEKRPKLTVTYTSTPIVYVQPTHGSKDVTVHRNSDYTYIKTTRYNRYTVTLFNIQGKMLCFFSGSKDTPAVVPVDALSHGTYIVQLTGEPRDRKDRLSFKLAW